MIFPNSGARRRGNYEIADPRHVMLTLAVEAITGESFITLQLNYKQKRLLTRLL